MVCALLESCGRFLHSSDETRQRTDALLELLGNMRSLHRNMPQGQEPGKEAAAEARARTGPE